MLLSMTAPPEVPASKAGTVLVVDDEESIVWVLRKAVESLGLQVVTASTAERALEAARTRTPDVKLPGMDGLKALEEFKRVAPYAKVVVMTAHGSLDTAVRALKLGALEYLPKPFDLAQVKMLVETALRDIPADASIQALRKGGPAPGGIVGRSPAMQELFRKIAAVSASDTSVLLIGESGTGKELLARAIHHNSARANGPFEAINCAAIPETLLESELYGHDRGAF